MSKKGIVLCLAVFLVCIAVVAWAQEKSFNRAISEKLITQIIPKWIPESFVASPNSDHICYVAGTGSVPALHGYIEKTISGPFFVVVDEAKGKSYNDITFPIFSPDSKRVGYGAGVGDKRFVVVDGKEGKQYDRIGVGSLIFSPDSKRVGYGAGVGDKRFVVLDGEEGKQYDAIGKGISFFSPDGRRVAYMAKVGEKQFVVVDGEEGKQYDGIVAEGGGRIIFDSPDSLHYLAAKGKDIYLVEERIK